MNAAAISESSPAPAVGQRRRSTASGYVYDVFDARGDGTFRVRFDDGSEGTRTAARIADHRYIGPTPSPSVPPVAAERIEAGDLVAVGPSGLVRAGQARPHRPAGIYCQRCRCTSELGDIHLETCPTQRESGPSATAAAPGRTRPSFADLCDEWDLLPEAGR